MDPDPDWESGSDPKDKKIPTKKKVKNFMTGSSECSL
jgi:hypothetical protein